jgi:endonuclease/exonuclease/phosphatase family metal-dependent hydrolase
MIGVHGQRRPSRASSPGYTDSISYSTRNGPGPAPRTATPGRHPPRRARRRGAVPFIVLGDFNRRFNRPGDRVWADLDDGDPANADLTALTQDMPISCRDNKHPEFIDHIVVDRRVLPWVDRTSFRHVTYRQADKAVWNQLSDHCPVLVELWVR